MISPTASAISCPAPDPPRCDVTPHDSTTRYPDDFTQVADSAKSEPRTGHRPPIGSALALALALAFSVV